MKRRHFLKGVTLLLLISVSVTAYAQGKNDSVAHISNYPVKEGYIYLWKDKPGTYADPATFVCIFSKDSNVFAVKEGKVQKIFTSDEFDSILITSRDTTLLYGNIDKFYKKAGDTIHKGDLIGTIKKDTIDNKYELYFKIAVGRKNVFYEDQIRFLQRL